MDRFKMLSSSAQHKSAFIRGLFPALISLLAVVRHWCSRFRRADASSMNVLRERYELNNSKS
jgi:hypothetical protein